MTIACKGQEVAGQEHEEWGGFVVKHEGRGGTGQAEGTWGGLVVKDERGRGGCLATGEDG